jgi:hypothetical protein
LQLLTYLVIFCFAFLQYTSEADHFRNSDEGLGDDNLPVVVIVENEEDDVEDVNDDVVKSTHDVAVKPTHDAEENDEIEDDFERQRNESESGSEGESGKPEKREKDPESPKDQGLVMNISV